ncbi:hypothetical protein [Thiocapsa rosea]|uniref:Uncharacterized protein n=1 Tax=Thiocapsa rosea TaxID=69360 RepID=A0A495V429_9GAMM|nr:hypothetical protein [Thiocapsa rosea]RKT43353.1 hypothetical protein BDD21_0684 [Thiocapsa rosea]
MTIIAVVDNKGGKNGIDREAQALGHQVSERPPYPFFLPFGEGAVPF